MADEEPRKIQIERSITLQVDEPGFSRPVLLMEGQTFTARPDGEGPPVDDLSNTMWETYAGEAQRILEATEEATVLAAREGVSLQEVEGTGKDGRILKGDVEKHLE